ncbi:MAG: ABC transporter permease [Pyrinomonadaceae bacterium]|nr:ABC transporter permease [Pyrinomonadaceae bacterium]
MIGTLLQDVRYGVRVLWKAPGFTLVAVLSLALGIGVNTATFSVLDAVLLRPLPISEPERLVTVFTKREAELNSSFSYPDYVDYRDRNEVFSGMIAWDGVSLNLNTGGTTERVSGQLVTGNFFDVLGVRAALGRTFLHEEDRTPGSAPVAVISDGFWRKQFGADPEILGKQVTINNHGFTIIGIAPANFTGASRGSAPNIWVPMMMQEQARPGSEILSIRNTRWLLVMGRLKPGITLEQSQAQMSVLAGQLAQANPNATEAAIVIAPGDKGHPRNTSTLDFPLKILMALVALVFLIACANVANLLLARASSRRKEISIRLAIGASRARLIRQLLTESMLLSLVGGAVSLVVAMWTTDVFKSFIPNALDIALDARVLGFTLLLALASGVLFGLVPALAASRPNLVPALKNEAGTYDQGGRRWNLRSLLVVAQIALSLIVLTGAGLFIKSLRNLQSIDAGFQADNLMVMSLDLRPNGYDKPRGQAFYRDLMERVENLPGIESASLARVARLSLGGSRRSVTMEGYEARPGENLELDFNNVGTRYLQTMGIPIVRGRDFTEQDREGAPFVVIINETMARRYFPNQEAVGKRLTYFVPPGSSVPPTTLEIIGVAKDGKYRSLREEPNPSFYTSFLQSYQPNMTLHVRATGDTGAVVNAVRREVQALDKNLPIFDVRTLAEQRSNSLYTERLSAALLGVFGVLALLLAAIGIYGVMAYSVNRRTHEIGIRMALGAQKADVLRLVVGQGMVMALIGVGIGLAGSFAATRFFASLLYGVSTTDPLVFAGVAVLLTLITFLACFIPARRATKVDPMIALRYE